MYNNLSFDEEVKIAKIGLKASFVLTHTNTKNGTKYSLYINLGNGEPSKHYNLKKVLGISRIMKMRPHLKVDFEKHLTMKKSDTNFGQRLVCDHEMGKTMQNLVNEKLAQVEEVVNKVFRNFVEKRRLSPYLHMTHEFFEENFYNIIQNKDTTIISLKYCEFAEKHIQELVSSKYPQLPYANSLRTALGNFQAFLKLETKKDDIEFADLRPRLATLFQDYLLQNQYTKGSVATYLNGLSAIYEKAVQLYNQDTVLLNPQNPFKARIKKTETAVEKRHTKKPKTTQKLGLTISEMNYFMSFILPPCDRKNGIDMELWRDIFVVNCYLGIRGNDIFCLRVGDIDFKKDTFTIIERKTAKIRTGYVRINEIDNILLKYTQFRQPNENVWGLIDKRLFLVENELELQKELKNLQSKYQRAIKSIMSLIFPEKHITPKAARKFFLNMFLDAKQASIVANHSNQNITEGHYLYDETKMQQQLEAYKSIKTD